jgi:uncharacterized protein (TIGR03083 family)
MTDKPITQERILRILEGQAAKTDRLIASLDASECDRPARGDGWTVKEIVAHMASGHEGMLALAQGRIPGGVDLAVFDIHEYNEAQRRRSASMSLAEVLDWLQTARQQVRAYVEELDETEYAHIVSVPWLGENPRGQFLLFPALHEGGHRVEIEQWCDKREAPGQ